jgi:hypothetical protein
MFMNSGTRGNKIGVMCSLSVSPLPPSLIKPGTRPEGLSREVPKKSFGINNWHSLGKGEKAVVKEKSGKDLGLLSGGKRRVFLARGVAKMYGRQAVEKRRFGEVFSKLDARHFCPRKLFWDTPVYHV